HLEVLDSPPEQVGPPARLIASQLDPSVVIKQSREADRGLESSQWRAKAIVKAIPEAEVRVGATGEVEAGGLGEAVRGAIGRRLHEVDELARLYPATAQLDLLLRPAGHELGWALVAQ